MILTTIPKRKNSLFSEKFWNNKISDIYIFLTNFYPYIPHTKYLTRNITDLL